MADTKVDLSLDDIIKRNRRGGKNAAGETRASPSSAGFKRGGGAARARGGRQNNSTRTGGGVSARQRGVALKRAQNVRRRGGALRPNVRALAGRGTFPRKGGFQQTSGLAVNRLVANLVKAIRGVSVSGGRRALRIGRLAARAGAPTGVHARLGWSGGGAVRGRPGAARILRRGGGRGGIQLSRRAGSRGFTGQMASDTVLSEQIQARRNARNAAGWRVRGAKAGQRQSEAQERVMRIQLGGPRQRGGGAPAAVSARGQRGGGRGGGGRGSSWVSPPSFGGGMRSFPSEQSPPSSFRRGAPRGAGGSGGTRASFSQSATGVSLNERFGGGGISRVMVRGGAGGRKIFL